MARSGSNRINHRVSAIRLKSGAVSVGDAGAQQRRRHAGRDPRAANPAGYNPGENPDYDPALCIGL